MSEVLSMYVMYERPRDYPDAYVLRRWSIVPGQPEPVSSDPPVCVAPTREAAERQVPAGLTRVGPWQGDEPQIIGVYV